VGDVLDKSPCSKLTITDKIWEGHQRRKRENKAKGKGFGYNLVNAESEHTWTISARYWKDGSEILVDQYPNNPRMLSPNECSRLQGFPDDFVNHKSNRYAYQQHGNSVAINVVQKIAENIKESLNENK